MINESVYFPKALSILIIVLTLLFFIPDIIMYKFFKIGFIEGSSAILFVPFVYDIADAITEVYGKNRALMLLFSCYFFSILFGIILVFVINLPSPNGHNNQEAFNIVFNRAPWAMFVGLISFSVSMYANVRLMAFLKKKARKRHFIIRSIISSSVGELIATLISYPLVFYNMKDSLLTLMLSAYCFKVLYSAIASVPANFIVFILRHVDGVKQEAFNEELSDFSQQKKG